jgi:N-acetylated-alpha-linked acidic dipeptidase
METLAAEVAQVVRDPQTGVSVSERLRSFLLVRGSADEKKEFLTRKNIRIDALGSGSDYSVFLQHLGIASYYIGFRGEGKGGEYHTCFDTFDHYAKYGDPDFSYGVALAQVCGRLTLRLADADILPFDFNTQAETINRYSADLVKQADTLREATETHNQLVADDRFRLAADPREKFVPPPRKDPVPHLNFAPLLNAGKNLQQGAAAFHTALERFHAANRLMSKAETEQLNQLIYQTERALIHEAGLPRRPWFRHQIYAPGFYTGYGVKTIPGVREGLEERKWIEAQEQIGHTAAALQRLAAQIELATALLKP